MQIRGTIGSSRAWGFRCAGDFAFPGVEHWHGAAPATALTHIAILEHVAGTVVSWGPKVTDAEYGAR